MMLRILVLLVSFAAPTFATPIVLQVDATEAARKIYHAELHIPTAPGPLTLFYPKWIPGDHAPSGPINDLAGLHISAHGQPRLWKRDSVELFAFHIDVPQGVSSIDVKLDFLSAAEGDGADSASPSSGVAVRGC